MEKPKRKKVLKFREEIMNRRNQKKKKKRANKRVKKKCRHKI